MIPNKLKKGDLISVVALSNIAKEDDRIFLKKSEELFNSIGLNVIYGKNIFNNTLGYGATPEERAKDLNEAFLNKDVKAIFSVKGGEDSNSLFEYIDYDLIEKNPKIICGFSDATSILNIIYEKIHLVTFHGPTFKSVSSWDTLYGFEEIVKRFLDGNNKLKREDEVQNVICQGCAEGELIGGNLSLVRQLVLGKYSIDFKDKILFIEELGFESSPILVNNFLYYMKQNDIFSKIKGLWIGNYEHESNIQIEKIVLDVLKGEFSFPIIKSNNFGHIDKKQVIPIGIRARIDTNKEEKIILLENCVK